MPHAANGGLRIFASIVRGLTFVDTSSEIVAMKSHGRGGIVHAGPLPAERAYETRCGPWPIFVGGSSGEAKPRQRALQSVHFRSGVPCNAQMWSRAQSGYDKLWVDCKHFNKAGPFVAVAERAPGNPERARLARCESEEMREHSRWLREGRAALPARAPPRADRQPEHQVVSVPLRMKLAPSGNILN